MKKDLSYYMGLPYKIETIKEPDEEGWVAYLPELRGCITTGLTEEDALENLKDAKLQWLATALELEESIPIPEPGDNTDTAG